VGYVACRDIGNAYKILVGIPEGKRPLGRPWHREYIIKMALKGIGCGLDLSGMG
jgi:hypothetical protein